MSAGIWTGRKWVPAGQPVKVHKPATQRRGPSAYGTMCDTPGCKYIEVAYGKCYDHVVVDRRADPRKYVKLDKKMRAADSEGR